MKKRLVGITALSAVIISGNAWSTGDATSRCQEYAKEDGIAAEEMGDYMAQCLEEQRLAQAEAEAEAESQSDDGKAGGASASND